MKFKLTNVKVKKYLKSVTASDSKVTTKWNGGYTLHTEDGEHYASVAECCMNKPQEGHYSEVTIKVINKYGKDVWEIVSYSK